MALNPSDSMQMEAVRRMQEMHGRSRAGSQPPKSRENEPSQTKSPPNPAPAPQAHAAINDAAETDIQSPDITELFADKDRTLVLIIILLLLGEHSDTSLVMALVYLIL